MYCQSDNASLCYECDQNVHSANFLVAKHSRTLLCHKCQSPTPWNASGVNLGRTASVCVNCLEETPSQRRLLQGGETSHRGNDVVEENCDVHDEDEDGDTDDDDTESSDESEDEDEDEDAENQVVPLSSAASPPATGSSSSEEFSSSRLSSDGFRSTSKRERVDPCIDSEVRLSLSLSLYQHRSVVSITKTVFEILKAYNECVAGRYTMFIGKIQQ